MLLAAVVQSWWRSAAESEGLGPGTAAAAPVMGVKQSSNAPVCRATWKHIEEDEIVEINSGRPNTAPPTARAKLRGIQPNLP